jgi:penicillin-insensitive murein endopeptidase
LAGNVKSWLHWAAVCAAVVTAVCAQPRAEEASAPDQREAKKAFSAIKAPAGQSPQPIGRYERGCIAGAQKLAPTGAGWQAMRLSRNRVWGHPILIAYIHKLANDARRLDGSPGILVGDMSQPIGGPLMGGHASHQIGLDVDIWYTPMPDRTLSAEDREHLAATNVVDQAALIADTNAWTETQAKLVRRAASYPEVARIFVHPAVKKALCETAGNGRAWLQKIRPWYKHDDHFHVRLNCPPGSAACVSQPPSAADDGCGAELDEWFKKLRTVPKKTTKPAPPPKPMLVSDLPKECQALLASAENASKDEAASTSH